MGVHPVASLIKDVSFEYRLEEEREGIYRPARLAVTASPWVSFAVTEGRRRFSSRSPWVTSSPNCRFFALSDFGSPSYDRYIEDSDIASGLLIGRVLG